MIITRDDERKQSTQQKRKVSYADYAELERQCRHLEEQCSTKDHQMESMRSYITDLLDTQDRMETRYQEHQEEEQEWFDERAELIAENTALKLQKHDALTEHNQEWCEACKLHSEVDIRRKEIDAIRRRILKLDHKQMGSSDKLVALDYLEQAAARYWNINDLSLPFHPVMEHMATRLGLSDAQMTRINKAQKTAQSWGYEVDRKFKERIGKKEIYDCVVTVNLDKLLTDPEGIEKPEGPKGSHQGGARVRTCKSCGSDDLDRYALEYCRSCQTAHAQLLPGLRSDANIHDALDAVKQDRLTIQDHVHEYSQDEKHDAFTPDEIAEIDANIETLVEHPYVKPALVALAQAMHEDEKHDAFDNEEDTTPIAQQTGQADNIIPFPGQTPAPAPQVTEQEEHSTSPMMAAPTIHTQDEKHDAFDEEQPTDTTPVAQCVTPAYDRLPEIDTEREKANQDEQVQDPPADAEKLPTLNNMQDKDTIRESLHDAPTREETAADYPHLYVDARVNTPAGLGTISIISQCPVLHRPRCGVRTDRVQPNGSQFAAFDLAQVVLVKQGTLL